MVNAALVHRLQQGLHAVAFLEEIHVVQMGVAVAVIARFAGNCQRQQKRGETGPQPIQGSSSGMGG
ncbi:hypothetical protein D9M72_649000 [compost metagenome]